MGLTEKQREKITRESQAALKKVVSGAGALVAHYYFTPDVVRKKKSELRSGLVVQLTARDPKGKKAFTQGKMLRADLGNGPFSLGSARFEAEKKVLVFEPRRGQLGKGRLQEELRQLARREDRLKLLGRVIVAQSGEDVTVQEGDAIAANTIAAIQKEAGFSQADIDALVKEQQKLGDLDAQLHDFFHNEDALNLELAEALQQHLAETQEKEAIVKGMASDDPDREAAVAELNAARRALAAVVYVDLESDLDPEAPLPEALQQALKLSIDSTLTQLLDLLTLIRGKMVMMVQKYKKMSQEKRIDRKLVVVERANHLKEVATTTHNRFQKLYAHIQQ